LNAGKNERFMKLITLFLSILISFSLLAQTDINKVDGQGRKQGVWKKPYENTKQYKYVGQFKDNVPYGKFVYYYEDGSVEAVIHFYDNGKLTRSQMYHHSGYMMAQGKYVNKEKDSTWVYYDDRGIISYQESYKLGKLDGQKVYFFEPKDNNLRVARYEYYKNGVLNGEFKEYYENSKLKQEGNYRDGNIDGVVKHYYPSGKIQKVCRYRYAVKHGMWIFYAEDGKEEGTKLYWEGKLLKGEAREKKEAELKALNQK
jgi:antitoxin component YwqK of YwqJK toxin-antitoxin module